MNNIVNQVAFLRTSREFPEELRQLTVEVNKAYVDIANVVNNRIISIFPVNRPARNGENWFFSSQRQEGFRQVYQFKTSSDIKLGFKLATVSQPTRCWGQYTDGTSFFGVIWGTSVVIAGQLSFYLTVDAASSVSDLIKFKSDGTTPAIVLGFVVIEWISQI